jgi:thymidylate synthase
MGEIVATHSECVGDSVEKAVKSLSHKIASANPGLQVHHAFYLGSELQKAAIAISTKTPYSQDKSLTVI